MKNPEVSYEVMTKELVSVFGMDKIKEAYKTISNDKEFKEFLTRSYNKINSPIYRSAKGFVMSGTRISVICNI